MEKRRKVRSDKKHEIKPSILMETYETISHIAYVTNTSMKMVAEYLCEQALVNKDVIDVLSNELRYPFTFELSHSKIVCPGNIHIQRPRTEREPGPTKRLCLRFKKDMDQKIHRLAFALGTTPTSATKILLKAALQNTDIVNDYIAKHVTENLDPERREKLNEIIAYMRRTNSSNEEISWTKVVASALRFSMDITKNTTRVLNDATNVLGKWIDQKMQQIMTPTNPKNNVKQQVPILATSPSVKTFPQSDKTKKKTVYSLAQKEVAATSIESNLSHFPVSSNSAISIKINGRQIQATK